MELIACFSRDEFHSVAVAFDTSAGVVVVCDCVFQKKKCIFISWLSSGLIN